MQRMKRPWPMLSHSAMVMFLVSMVHCVPRLAATSQAVCCRANKTDCSWNYTPFQLCGTRCRHVTVKANPMFETAASKSRWSTQ
ncbi:hypothetical protein CLAFUW4_20080 [Fulvia fulva]|uniref:uncharacterized protein n=1 Tax=Passalora fulva TaxID=5499 RepID=UPI00285270FB|nr:uncharacterized protein CLAFUR5_20080 [Fulvia fulva]KAK4613340.1 hypothetical protein CLAFUR4_20080 [Fulvia fulva]KAK4614772.1 hypothetical protein CLAFUR0_20080 [Fulvia fulva]WMI39001.1 hypothetical protein CLAFUR5_20080 [Fulvia fulva]WPV19803.1 hypothetical protein CLAFUW4_20080 [Fulvia fulva]WPV35027.1 hypothetical protein CLAFUW7_20080 [Fulvia fulva]